MWVRKRVDIRLTDIFFAVSACARSCDRQACLRAIEELWQPEFTLVCLSVRSGFELLMQGVCWPQGSEILFTGLTIPDMPRIAEKHGYRPRPLDLTLETLAVQEDQIRSRITPQTKAIVIAHLFGGLIDLNPVVRVAQEFGLMVIEDCAQAYAGSSFQGDDRADVSMFSFGPIKTNTSLGGGVLVVRDRVLLARLGKAHEAWPLQSNLTMLRRLVKYTLVKTLSTYAVAGILARVFRCLGRDHDQLAIRLSRGFVGRNFFQKIRQRPSAPLLRLMHRRFQAFEVGSILQRTQLGDSLAQALADSVYVLGSESNRQTYWVFAILVPDRDTLIQRLWRKGFDATKNSSLRLVAEQAAEPSPAVAELSTTPLETFDCPQIQFILEHIVFLPFDSQMGCEEIQRLARTILMEKRGRG